MALPSSASKDSGSRDSTYCRKQKSLGLLCTNFLSLYNRDCVETIGLDDAATRLGVQRRRIYDIVNVLESLGVLAKKSKNRCSWKGFGGIPKVLQELREEGFRDNFNTFGGNNHAKVSDDDEDEKFSNPITSSQNEKSNPCSVIGFSMSSKTDKRKEKSLGLLTKKFVKLFLCSNVDLISLEEAARILLGDAHDSSMMRTKVRRLYDIANVLSSTNFIEKIDHPESRKSVFRWLAIRGEYKNGSANAFNLNESKKRTFGTEITNTSFKRSKMVSPIDGNSNHDTKMHLKCEALENEVDKNNLEDSRRPKNFQFGPFAPVSVSKLCAAENSEVKQVHDWESLAVTYRPQYHNQALGDIFAHYLEAWKSWHSEAAGKKPIQLIS